MALSKMSPSLDEIVTPLNCPVCYSLPDAAVYQCIHGHLICESCFSNLPMESIRRNSQPTKRCPTCRVYFGNSMIRSRAAESVLDVVLTKCTFEGCPTKVVRDPGQLEAHKLVCSYRPFDICRTLWDQVCSFESAKTDEVIQHLNSCHKECLTFLQLDSSNKVIYSLDNVLSWSKMKEGKSVKDIAIVDKGNWIIIRQVTTPMTSDHHGDVSWVVFSLSNSPNDTRRVNINVQTSNLGKDLCKWMWSGKPFFYKDASRRLTEPDLRVRFEYIKKCIPHGDPDVNLTVEVVIEGDKSKDNSNRMDSDGITDGLGLPSPLRPGAAAIRENLRHAHGIGVFRGIRLSYNNWG